MQDIFYPPLNKSYNEKNPKEQQKTANAASTILKLGLQSGNLIFRWPSMAFDELFGEMDAYKSTEWICSLDHAEKIGKNQVSNALKTCIKTLETFKFEKTLIISEDSWTKPETWDWVWEIFSIITDNPEKSINIRVIKEEKVKAIVDKEYFDMGIYKVDNQQFVGFLNHNPLEYTWQLGEDHYKEAEQNFTKLNAYAEPNDSILEILAKHVSTKR
ncbi:MAG: hypothetical protein LBC03_02165 [Nitrososphaerota archaeon]|nr:hypothetical protein [Nitrososphaerota archaeon]